MMDAERRRAALALVPLGVIAVGLVVPPIVSAPAHVAVISPWQDGWQMFWWVHLAAGVLAVLGAVAVWRRIAPGPVIVSIACVAIAGMLYAPARLLQFAWHDEHALAALFAAELVAGVALLVLAWRATGWRRWMHLLGAYAALTVHYGCPVVTGMLDAFSGGVTFIAALATLAVLAGRVLSKQTILAFAIGAAGVSVYAASRPRGGPRAGATSPETAVRGALEAAVRGMDPDTFLLDDARCRALYAGDDAPPISELGRASDEASCARGAASLRDALRRLATGGITFELGARTTDRFGRIAFPVTLHSNSTAAISSARRSTPRRLARAATRRRWPSCAMRLPRLQARRGPAISS
ncbi:MAG TPA: hypothetical protein VGF94_15600 [Kofleriaceae bacterium]